MDKKWVLVIAILIVIFGLFWYFNQNDVQLGPRDGRESSDQLIQKLPNPRDSNGDGRIDVYDVIFMSQAIIGGDNRYTEIDVIANLRFVIDQGGANIQKLGFVPLSHGGSVPHVCEGTFIRGDANGDDTFSALIDTLFMLEWAFLDGDEPGCTDRLDANDDESINTLVDGLYILEFAFLQGPIIPGPYPDPGYDEEGVDGSELCDEVDNDSDGEVDEGETCVLEFVREEGFPILIDLEPVSGSEYVINAPTFVNNHVIVTRNFPEGEASIFGYDSEGGELEDFPIVLDSDIMSVQPAVADINDDGDEDFVVFAANDDSLMVYVYIYDEDTDSYVEHISWEVTDAPTLGFYSPPTLSDINGDGYMDLVAITEEFDGLVELGNLFAWSIDDDLTDDDSPSDVDDLDNPVMFGFPYGYDGIFSAPSISIADLDGDDLKEIIVQLNNNVNVIDSTGGLVWTELLGDTFLYSKNSPIIADFDEDGSLEILVISAAGDVDNFQIYDADGELLWSWNVTYTPGVSGGIYQAPLVIDLDGDGDLEIVFYAAFAGGGDSRIVAYHHEGDEVEGWPFDELDSALVFFELFSLTALDISGDGEPEIIAIFNDEDNDWRLGIISYEGELLTSILLEYVNDDGDEFIIIDDDELAFVPVIRDFDGDGFYEVVLSWYSITGGNQGYVELFELSGVLSDDSPVIWPDFQADPAHTGCFEC
jgi:hypothetical protein